MKKRRTKEKMKKKKKKKKQMKNRKEYKIESITRQKDNKRSTKFKFKH